VPGCEAHSSHKFRVQFKLPLYEKDKSEENKLGRRSSATNVNIDTRAIRLPIHGESSDEEDKEEEKALMDICPSWLGQVFQVQYFFKVYLKHDGLFEKGPGKWCNLPLKILSTRHLEPSTEPFRVPNNWNPW